MDYNKRANSEPHKNNNINVQLDAYRVLRRVRCPYFYGGGYELVGRAVQNVIDGAQNRNECFSRREHP
jgi:hypothetical protein